MQKLTTKGIEQYTLHLREKEEISNTWLVPVGDCFYSIYKLSNNSDNEKNNEDNEDDCKNTNINTNTRTNTKNTKNTNTNKIKTLFERLYVPDDYHPSRLGSYAAACVFVYTILVYLYVN